MEKRRLLDLFKYLFDQNRSGAIVTLSEIHQEFAYRNKAGAIDKENLQNLINALVEANRIEVLSETEFRISSGPAATSKYEISDLAYIESQDQHYGNGNGMQHPLHKLSDDT